MNSRAIILAATAVLSVLHCAADGADAVPPGTRVTTYSAPRAEWSSDGTLGLKVDFAKFRNPRAFWDIPFRHDLSAAKGISFEYRCDDLSPIMSARLHLNSGNGWYDCPVVFEREGAWTRIDMAMEDIGHVEGAPAGLGEVSLMRFSFYSACATNTTVRLRNFKVERQASGAAAPKILVVRSDHSGNVVPSQRGSFMAFASRFSGALSSLGLQFEQTSDLDLTAAKLEGKELVVLPYNRFFPKDKAPLVRDFVSRGGKLFMAFFKTQWLEDLIGVETNGSYFARKEGDAEIVGFLRKGEGMPGQPEFAPNRAWSATRVVPDGKCRVWATWTDAARKRTDLPALVETPTGMFMSYVLTGGATGNCGDLLYSVVAQLVPSLKGDVAKLRAERTAANAALQAEVDAMPGRVGERRLAWCINPFGLDGSGDWEQTAQFLERHGFTDVIVCLARAGVAFYKSKVLPTSADVATRGDQLEIAKAACRRHGVRLHAWKMCWVVGNEPESKAVYEAAEKEGRVMVSRSGGKKYRWLCPGDPKNQDLEIAAMTELAGKGVDGIQFDFIRYVEQAYCYCDGCRERFEASIGTKAEGWPACTLDGGAYAAEWNRFRCDNITRVVREVNAKVRGVKPGVEISAAVFKNADNDVKVVGQDWSCWCREGWLDFVCPMDYTSNWISFRTLVRIQKKQHGKAKLYPGIGLSDYSSWQHGNSDAWRLARQIGVVREEGLEGFTLFELDNNATATLPLLLKGPLRRQSK